MKNQNINTHIAIFICVLISNLSIALLTKSNSQYLNFNSEVENKNDSDPVHLQNLRKAIKASERVYSPMIVDNVEERKKIIASPRMSKAETVRAINMSKEEGFKEKPVMYTTIISPQKTAITHSNGKRHNEGNPNENKRLQNIKVQTRRLLNLNKEQPQPTLYPGQYALKVELKEQGKNLANRKIQKIKDDEEFNEESYLKQVFASLANSDLDKINNSVKDSSNVDSSIKKLLTIRKQLKSEAKELLLNLRKRIKKIANINTIDEKLNGLLKKIYTEKKKGVNSDVKHLIQEYEEKMKKNNK